MSQKSTHKSTTLWLCGLNSETHFNMPKGPMDFWLGALARANGIRPHFTKKYERASLLCPNDRIPDLLRRLHEELDRYHGEIIILHTENPDDEIKQYDFYTSPTGWEILVRTVADMQGEDWRDFGFEYAEPNYCRWFDWMVKTGEINHE